MSFRAHNEDGSPKRYKLAVIDCSKDDIIVEQHHAAEVNINNIVKRHGVDLVAKTAALQQKQYIMDDNPNNDFQEAMFIVTKAQQSFEALPSAIRKQFHNSPAEYLDFIQNPENGDKLVKMGLAIAPAPPPDPIKVQVTNAETPPPSGEAA